MIIELLMVINDFNVVGIAAFETKANPPPIIDADTPLPDAIARQRLQSVGRRQPQILNPRGRMQLHQPHNCAPENLRGQAARFPRDEEAFRFCSGEGRSAEPRP